MPTTGDEVAEYREAVPASRWLALALYGSAGLALVATLAVAIADGSTAGRLFGAAVLLATAAILLLVARWFLVLHVTVDGGALDVRYGPFGRRLAAGTIESVGVEHYRWLPYAGWGIRVATDGRRAYSAPFVREGIAVQTRDGKRYHISSRAPAQLEAAVVALIDDGPGGGDAEQEA